jgi:hypothetical protein
MSYTRNFRSLELYLNLEGCSWPRPQLIMRIQAQETSDGSFPWNST